MHVISGLAIAAALPSAYATAFQGFNYGAQGLNGAIRQQTDFEAQFKAAQNLPGAPGNFNSARLYTTIQGDTSDEPISAIPAAISTNTSLLLGIWASAGVDVINQEISALKSAITKYGGQFTNLVVGISVGSEDLYRDSVIGQQHNEGKGAGPDQIVSYIKQVKDAVKGTALSNVPVGHTDTWTAWIDGSNQAVIEACDWIGTDAYPYFQNTMQNSIDKSKDLFESAISQVKAVAGDKPIWVTETGFPTSGATVRDSVPSIKNAETYWKEVGCPAFGQTNIWWFVLEDQVSGDKPVFNVIDSATGKPAFDLSCSNSQQDTPSPSLPGNTTSSTSGNSHTPVASGSISGNSGSGSGNGLGSNATTPSGRTSPSSLPENTNGATYFGIPMLTAVAAATIVILAL